MRALYSKAKSLALTRTAIDTYLLFSGNFLNAGFGFIFTILIARALSVEEFGIFSAVNNLIYILIPLTDLGTTSGLVRFVAELESKNKHKQAEKYIKAALIFKMMMFAVIAVTVVLFSRPFAQRLLATSDHTISYWTLVIALGMFLPSFIPLVLQAKKLFLRSVIVDASYAIGRVALVSIFLIGGLTLNESFSAFALTGLVSLISIIFVYGFSFLRAKPSKKTYKSLLSFSGWLGVNRVISSVASRLDVQQLALLSTASAISYYSIAGRLAFFISFLAGSFSAVIAPRLSSFNDRSAEILYIKKSLLALIPVCLGILLWIVVAEPFVLIFGEQYRPAVNVFRVLALGMIPFILTAPSVAAIIYAIKKPKYIGYFSFVQLTLVVILNSILIPISGPFGPAVTIGFINVLLLIYSWAIVIRHYR